MSHVLLVSTDIVGPLMAGPGIRALELAQVLAQHHTVSIAVPVGSDPPPCACQVLPYQLGQAGALTDALAHADLVIGQGMIFQRHPELLAAPQPLAIDLYDPEIIETLHRMALLDPTVAAHYMASYVALTEAQLRRGDFFFCATERQRDYWLGALSLLGRLTPARIAQGDLDLRSLIDLVPSGIAAAPPTQAAPVLRGRHPAIPPDALLLIWAGGLWDWFDPQLVVRAVAGLRKECPRLRLCLFAGARLNPDGPPLVTQNALALRTLAAEMGVLDQTVILLDTWVPYAERGSYLVEADIGVSAHLPGIETRFAFRTRLLDYLWARRPLLVSSGDSLGDQLCALGGGLSIAPGDLAGWMHAIRTLYQHAEQRGAMAAALDHVAHQYTWEHVAQPLLAFCDAPRRTSSSYAAPAEDRQHAYIRELETTLATKNEHIAHLETHLRRIENGRLMRMLNALRGAKRS
ncbi:glycosyltransferase family 4 protein [Candidatus Viridilinea mediisalina]|uniref:Glycosyl transferase family 1 n=1 Tax=Candidatus Viridilinea mediisalina TaxID=2024553 RepID=A0A2A6RLW6_9CHLR|nr:glycosyltransferase family 4 protein [Candidatus Viridilinea mediisalina]PDW04062.1 hypothetical protein CJ255_05685 [Candidatus Viridilinea mediisalina]